MNLTSNTVGPITDIGLKSDKCDSKAGKEIPKGQMVPFSSGQTPPTSTLLPEFHFLPGATSATSVVSLGET